MRRLITSLEAPYLPRAHPLPHSAHTPPSFFRTAPATTPSTLPGPKKTVREVNRPNTAGMNCTDSAADDQPSALSSQSGCDGYKHKICRLP